MSIILLLINPGVKGIKAFWGSVNKIRSLIISGVIQRENRRKTMREHKRVLLLILIMATSSLIVAGIAIFMLYHAAFEEERARLVETAQSQARLIEAVARFEAEYSSDYPGGWVQATLSQIVDAHKHYRGFGETGEFTLARREADSIVFLLSRRHYDLETLKPVPFDSELAEPMRRALSGMSGTVVGFDYRGEVVLAAYEPVAGINCGIVAKIDLAEIRMPFVRAGVIAVAFTVLVVLAGATLFLRISNPIIKGLEKQTAELAKANEQLKQEIDERRRVEKALRESEGEYRNLFEHANDSIFIIDPSTHRFLDVNENAAKRLGYVRDELLGLTLDDIDTPMAAQRNDTIIRELLDTGSVTFEHAHLRKDGTNMPVEISSRVTEYGGRRVFENIVRDITERKRAEKILQTSHRLLEIANRHMEMTLLLKEFLAEIRNFTGCAAVGLRILNDEGNIPYQVYEGFGQRFYESENPLSINSDQCMCINVIKGSTDPKLPFYTEGGSFYMNGTTSFLATVSEGEKGQTRNVCNQFGYESVALAPIRVENRLLGLVHVADPRENMVPLEMVEVLEGAAMQLGVAIQRVRVEEALKKAHDELEQKVEDRTAELKREIKERKQAEELLRESENHLRHLSSQLLTAQENERKRIALELHDGIGQSLSALKFGVENSLKQMDKGTARPIIKPLEAVIPIIQESIEEVRKIAMDLRPATLDDLGILATISWFCREFETIYSGIRIEQQIDIQENEVPELQKTVIYRVMQEAMNNIAKHSKADLVRLSLRKTDSVIELVVEDNGLGFDLADALSVESSRKRIRAFQHEGAI